MAAHDDFFRELRSARTCCAVGIDLGTTNSTFAVARVDEQGELSVSCLRDGRQDDRTAPIVIPTAVAVDSDRLVFGRTARRLSAERIESAHGKSVFVETKNEIGLRYSYWKAPPVSWLPG